LKKNLVLSLSLCIVVIVALVAGCTQTAPSTTAAPAPTTAAPAVAAKPIELIFSHTSAGNSGIGMLAKAWGDRIEKDSNGRVKFVYYWAGTLVPIAEQVKGIKTGQSDVAQLGPLSIASYMPVSYNIVYLPFLGYPSMEAGTKIWWDLYNKYPVMKDEWSDVKLLASRMMPPDQIHTTKKQVKVPGDVKGVKLAISSALISKVIKAQDGAATPIPPTDIAVSLSTGVVEGWVNHFPVANIFGTIPLFKYHLVVGTNDFAGIDAGMDQVIMSKAKWDSMPADIQKIITDASAWYTDEAVKMDMTEIQKALKVATDAKNTITYLTPAEIKVWSDAAAPVHQEWIKDMESKGKQVAPLYEEAKKLIQTAK
jgi:TRAP-type transport system periplasmic protein